MISSDRHLRKESADRCEPAGAPQQPAPPLDTSSKPAPLYRVIDEPLADSHEARLEDVLIMRRLDRAASITAIQQYQALPHMTADEEVDPIVLMLVKLNGLAAGHSLGTLWEAINTPGAEILILERASDGKPVGYMSYFTREVPDHFSGLDTAARSVLGPEARYLIADTVVIADSQCRGGYTFMMAQMILECREKCGQDGISRLLTMVRLYPNPNVAAMDHERMGWQALRDGNGREIYIDEMVCPESTAERTPALFKLIYLDIYSETADRIIAAARGLARFEFVDLDGPRRDFPPL